MQTSSSLPSYQLTVLDAILADRRVLNPESAEKLLLLCTHLYIKAPRESVYADYMRGAEALFQLWYLDAAKFDEVQTKHYPHTVYPDVCICGTKFSATGSTLRVHCENCEGNHSKQLVGAYDIQRISSFTGVNQSYLQSIFAKAIYYYM